MVGRVLQFWWSSYCCCTREGAFEAVYFTTLLSTYPPVSVLAAVKFPRAVETAWLLSSTLGFFLDVFVYHTFSLFLKSVIKLRTCPAHICFPVGCLARTRSLRSP